MYFRQSLLLLCLLLSAVFVNAQVQLTVKVTDPKKAPVPFATVRVVALADSSQVQQGITDSSGMARLQLAATGAYRVQASSASFITAEKGLRISAGPAQFALVLEPSGTLGAVVVTATRPVMRQEDDKTIVEPENLAASSTNAYELIEKTPGLFMDQDGNIYLNSTTPATIYINGREQKMSTADIATLLKNLPPNSIARLEILRTPSARYDASGGGGIVNVVLRKGVRPGLTGSVNAVASQGRFGTQSVGVNLNNNNGRSTTYLNLQYSRRDGFEELLSKRYFRPDSVLRQQAFTRYPGENYYAGFGISFPAGRRWELAYDGRVSVGRTRNRSENLNSIEGAQDGAQSSENNTTLQNSGRNFSLVQGLSAKYKIDSAGSEWTTDLSVNWAPNKTTQELGTVARLPSPGSFQQQGLIDNQLRFFSAQSNLVKKLPRKLTLEGGLKATVVNFRNSTTYERTRAYRYDENINAAYAQASKGFGGFVLKTGLRVENTNMSGHQLQPKDTSFSLRRTDLFPYVYLSRDIMKIMGYQLRAYLVYRRTISRPAYEYLNPAPRVVDPYLQESGNPTLRPQFTQNYEANVSVDERPILAIGVNETRDIFTQVVYQSDSNRKQVAFRTYDNLGNNKELYFRALGAIPGKKVFVVAGVQYNENFYQGFYEGKPLSFRRGTWMLFTYQTYKVTPLTQITVNGFMRMRGQSQFYELSTFGALNLSVTQQLFKKKLALTVSGNDLFYTNRNEFELKQGSVYALGERRSDTRRFVLSLRYQFGFRKKEDSNPLNVDTPQ
ncbi:MAG: TonB-dependent receptor [Chitinophagaceae bacterium]|nr:MAG: TonB-dependent receptor [Chitinophagaceae bacterium]